MSTYVTLDQLRAADAWNKAQGCSREYVNLSKGLPALIMNSGLMQVVAFLNEKGGKNPQSPHRQLGEHLRSWLQQRFPTLFRTADFPGFMEALMKAGPRPFQQVTAEAMAWLRWSRQMAAAIGKED